MFIDCVHGALQLLRAATRPSCLFKQSRVIDESGDDYLYPAVCFAPIVLPQAVRKAVLAAV